MPGAEDQAPESGQPQPVAGTGIWTVRWVYYPPGERQPEIDFYTREDAVRCSIRLAEMGRVGIEVLPQTVDLPPEMVARKAGIWERIEREMQLAGPLGELAG